LDGLVAGARVWRIPLEARNAADKAPQRPRKKGNFMALIAALFGMTLAFSSMLLSYYILTPKKRNQSQNHSL
jgi:purine-cytosine permease-like protein